MAANTKASREAGPKAAAAGAWRLRILRTTKDIAGVIGPVLETLSQFGYSESDAFAIHLSLEEALVNAVKHGHRGDPTKHVRFRYDINEERFLCEVEDEGPGFDPAAVADPLDPANLERDGGRGLFLMRHHMNAVCHNAAGNCVTLCKRRAPA